MAQVRSVKRGDRYEAQFQFGTYWFPVKKSGRVVTFASSAAARAAADKARPRPARVTA